MEEDPVDGCHPLDLIAAPSPPHAPSSPDRCVRRSALPESETAAPNGTAVERPLRSSLRTAEPVQRSSRSQRVKVAPWNSPEGVIQCATPSGRSCAREPVIHAQPPTFKHKTRSWGEAATPRDPTATTLSYRGGSETKSPRCKAAPPCKKAGQQQCRGATANPQLRHRKPTTRHKEWETA